MTAQQLILSLVLATMVFSVALELRVSDFTRVAQTPRAVICGLIPQFVLLPGATWLVTLALELPPNIEAAMLLVAACPGGSLSNVVTHQGRGNTALSVSISAVASVLALFLTPFNFTWMMATNPVTAGWMRELAIDPSDILFSLLALLALPMALGLALGHYQPALTEKIRKPLGNFSLLGSWDRVGFIAALLFVFTLLLADFFDTMGTMTAIGAEAGLLDEDGAPIGAQRILVVDSIAAAAGGAAGVSSNTSYIESASGVGDGARTGLASVVTGVLFLLSMVFAPIVEIIPNEAAVPALVLVGFLMMTQVRNIEWDDVEIAIPAFLTIVLMPFTYSISVGIGAGFLAYVVIKIARGKAGAVHPLMWVVSALFVVYFAIDPIKQLVGS